MGGFRVHSILRALQDAHHKRQDKPKWNIFNWPHPSPDLSPDVNMCLTQGKQPRCCSTGLAEHSITSHGVTLDTSMSLCRCLLGSTSRIFRSFIKSESWIQVTVELLFWLRSSLPPQIFLCHWATPLHHNPVPACFTSRIWLQICNRRSQIIQVHKACQR